MNKIININDTILKTEHLLLRRWKYDDLDDFFSYASVNGVGQMAGWIPHKNKNETKRILDYFINNKETFAIEYKNKVIGSIGIDKYNEKYFPEFNDLKCRELGFVLSKDYWGRGFMPEALTEVIRFLFEDINLDIIMCGYFIWNNQSKKVQEKCGFIHYKSIKYKASNNVIENLNCTILTKKEWLKYKL